jgi:hypothetical protein
MTHVLYIYVCLGYLGVSLYVYECVCTYFYIYVCRIDLRGLNFFTSHLYMNIFRQCGPLVPRVDYTIFSYPHKVNLCIYCLCARYSME